MILKVMFLYFNIFKVQNIESLEVKVSTAPISDPYTFIMWL